MSLFFNENVLSASLFSKILITLLKKITLLLFFIDQFS